MKSEIVTACAEMFGVHPRDLVGHFKFKYLSPARFALYTGLHMRGWSYARIGRFLNRDHSTILYGVGKAQEMIASDPEYAAKVKRLAELSMDELSSLPIPTYRWVMPSAA